VHHAQVGHFGDAPILCWRNAPYRREDRNHGVVDPDLYCSKLPLDIIRSCRDGFSIRHVSRDNKRAAAAPLNLSLDFVEGFCVASDQADTRAGRAEP
jgi:hypothetical protein